MVGTNRVVRNQVSFVYISSGRTRGIIEILAATLAKKESKIRPLLDEITGRGIVPVHYYVSFDLVIAFNAKIIIALLELPLRGLRVSRVENCPGFSCFLATRSRPLLLLLRVNTLIKVGNVASAACAHRGS